MGRVLPWKRTGHTCILQTTQYTLPPDPVPRRTETHDTHSRKSHIRPWTNRKLEASKPFDIVESEPTRSSNTAFPENHQPEPDPQLPQHRSSIAERQVFQDERSGFPSASSLETFQQSKRSSVESNFRSGNTAGTELDESTSTYVMSYPPKSINSESSSMAYASQQQPGIRSQPTIHIPKHATKHSSGPLSSNFPSSLIASSAGPLLAYPNLPPTLKSPTMGSQKRVPAIKEDGTDGSEDLGPAAGHSEVIVELNNVHKTYLLGVEGVPALRGVSVRIHRGEWVVVYGTSGGGKTSLLNIIGTIDTPTKGDMKICGMKISPQTKDWELASLRLNKLGFVFQTFNLLPSMTARENVELPMTLSAHHTPSVRRASATASLHRVGLGHRLNHFPNQLSGGEQQRVTIARAIANEPELLLLDEPTGDLDTISTNKIVELLHRLNVDHAMTLVMVTHDVHLKNFAHRVIYMRDGKLAKQEIVSPFQRQKAVTELYERIKTDKRLRGSYAGLEKIIGNGGSNRGEGDSGPAKGGVAGSWNKTEIRDPRGYATFSEKALPASFIPRSAFPRQGHTFEESIKGKGLENNSVYQIVK